MQTIEKAQRNKTLMARFQAKRQVSGEPCESKAALRKSPFPQSAVLRSPRLDTHLHPPSTNCKPASLPPASWSMPGSLNGKKNASSCSASLRQTRNPLPPPPSSPAHSPSSKTWLKGQHRHFPCVEGLLRTRVLRMR